MLNNVNIYFQFVQLYEGQYFRGMRHSKFRLATSYNIYLKRCARSCHTSVKNFINLIKKIYS